MRYTYILILIAFVLSGCATDKMPEQRPEDFTVTYTEDGGMLDKSKTIFFSKDSSYVSIRNYGAENKTYILTSKADLDNIYKVLKENNFEHIDVREEEKVYDRGGNTVSVSFGGETISKSNSGLSFVEDSWQKQYGEVTTAINKLADDFLEKMKRNFKIEIDTTLLGDNTFFRMQVNDEYTYDSQQEGNRESILLNVLDGEQMFFVTLKEGAGGKEKTSEQYPIRIDGMMAGVKFYLDSGEIKWSPTLREFN